jgi:hypothetical protein
MHYRQAPDDARDYPFDSAVDGASGTTITGTARSAIATTCSVGLIAQQVDVDEVGAEAAVALATSATHAALATTATTDCAEQRHHGTARQQLGTLPIELSPAQCV